MLTAVNIKYQALLTADHEVLLRVLLSALDHLETEPPAASRAHRRLARARADAGLEHVPEKVTILAENLEKLQHLGLALAVLVTGVSVHNVVKSARRTRPHLARWPLVVWVGGVNVK